jgi:hypothetical protein
MWMHAPHCTANIYNVIHTLKYISLISEEGAKKAVRKRNKAERERRTCDGAVCRNGKKVSRTRYAHSHTKHLHQPRDACRIQLRCTVGNALVRTSVCSDACSLDLRIGLK